MIYFLTCLCDIDTKTIEGFHARTWIIVIPGMDYEREIGLVYKRAQLTSLVTWVSIVIKQWKEAEPIAWIWKEWYKDVVYPIEDDCDIPHGLREIIRVGS